MFARKPNPALTELNTEISRVLAVLARIEPDSDEYASAVEHWTKLCAERSNLTSNRFTKDQMLAVGGNLAGIIAIVAYEQKHVFVSKAGTFVGKFNR